MPNEESRAIGHGVHFDSVTDAATVMKRRLEQEVIAPLKHWMLSYKTAQVRSAAFGQGLQWGSHL